MKHLEIYRSLKSEIAARHFAPENRLPGESSLASRFHAARETVRRALAQLQREGLVEKRNGIGGEKAAKAFIRIFNGKLLESPRDNELSWSHWFFPVINTTDSLHVIDQYAQDCLRYLIAGTHTKARFNVRYEDLKALGYCSLVHEYYEGVENEMKSGRPDAKE